MAADEPLRKRVEEQECDAVAVAESLGLGFSIEDFHDAARRMAAAAVTSRLFD